MKKILCISILSTLCSCATISDVEDSARQKAAFELDCPENKIALTQLSSDMMTAVYSYGAVGCGKKTSYICQKSAWGGALCVKESETTQKK